MERTDKRQRNALTFLLIIAVVGTVIYMIAGNVAGSPPLPPDSEPTEVPVDTNGDGIPDTTETVEISFSMYQALYLRFSDGSSAWKYPQSRTILEPMTITDVSTGKQVSNIQSYIYFTLKSSKQVSYVTFSASATIKLYGLNAPSSYTLATMPINEVAGNVQNDVDTFLVSSSMSASDFESYIQSQSFGYYPQYTYSVQINDIKATVKFVDGSSQVYGLTGVQATENRLYWAFRTSQTSPMEITSVQTEWSWT